MSPSVPSASAAPASPEIVLFRAYGDVAPGQRGMFKATRIEQCACGGTLMLFGEQSVETVVEAHNETAIHRAWRTWRDMR